MYINYIGLSAVLVNLNIFIANIIDSYYQMYISIKYSIDIRSYK